MNTDSNGGTSLQGQKALATRVESCPANVKRYDRRMFLKMTGIAMGTVAAASMVGGLSGQAEAACGTGTMTGTVLDPLKIPKWVTQLVIPPVYDINGSSEIKVDAAILSQQILPAKNLNGTSTGFGPTTVYAYGGKVKDPVTGKTVSFRHSPGATFLVTKGKATRVEWINNITGPHIFAVDPTIHWANPNKIPAPKPPFKAFPPGYLNAQDPVPMVTHLHGAEVPSVYDGGPEVWFTRNGKVGPKFTTRHYVYPNEQQATSMFYHDHALGMTRLNVYAGLAGFYVIQDPKDRIAPLLPSGKYWLPLAIQDRSFYVKDSCGNNELAFTNMGNVPDVHPYWAPEFFGNAIMVNGHTWPYVNVDKGQYRITLLNGSNARFYNLFFDHGVKFTLIGVDGGYLQAPVYNMSSYLLAPGSRAEILVDFTGIATGTQIIMMNNASAPFPTGDPANFNANTVGQIIKFIVGKNPGFKAKTLPRQINPTLFGPEWPAPHPSGIKRIVTLNEQLDMMGNSTGLFLNGQMWDAPVSETPKNGSTEDWYFVNLTADTHPMHLHLVQFNIMSRQTFNKDKYLADWMKLNQAGLMNGMLPFKMNWATRVLPIEPYLQGSPVLAPPEERGWKDIVPTPPNMITRIRVRFKKQDDTPYGFDPTAGPGYVWHCHIIDHEDNEMMRPMIIKK